VTLFQDKNERIIVLKDRMIGGTFLDSPGMHLKSTGRAKVGAWMCFQSEGFGCVLELDVRDNDIQIFKV